jgi:hypothetical protein
VDALSGTEAADDADFRFFVVLGPAEKEFLLRGELVPGEDTRAVETKENGLGGFREDTTV